MKKSGLLLSMLAAGVIAVPTGFAAEAAAPAAAPTAKAPAKDVDVFAGLPEVVAEYNGQKVTRAEIAAFCKSQFPDGKLPADFTAEAVKNAAMFLVKNYVDDKLIDAAMTKEGVKADLASTKVFLEAQIKKAPKAQLEFMAKQLTMQGTTMEKYVEKLASDKNVQRQIAQQIFAEKTYLKSINITDADAKAFYEKNKDMFKTPADPAGSIRASHILILVDDKADDAARKAALEKITKILEQLKKNPALFEALAKTDSQCPSNKRGGSLGAFNKGAMVPEFEAATLKLKDGEISGIVKTQFGYHIIRRDKLAGDTVESFDAVKDQLMQMLKSQEMQKAHMKFVEGLEKNAGVKYFVTAPAMPQMMMQ